MAPNKLLIVIDSVYVDDSKILNILTADRIKIFLQQNFWNPAVIHRQNESKIHFYCNSDFCTFGLVS